MLDEALLVGRFAGLDAQPRLEGCERTVLPKPGLNDYNGYSYQMRQSEPQVVDPTPTQPIADQDNEKPANDEEHNSEVDGEHCIS